MAEEDSFDINKIINSVIGGNGPALAGIGSAIAGYNTGNNYEQLGREAADRADPFGSRDFYRDRLRTSYDDPSAILNDPGHKIQVERGLGQVQATNAAQGYLGSGRMLQELSKYASDSDATYLDAERKQLGNLAGAQFDPANASRALMEGGKLSLEAKNKALDALVTGLTMRGGPSGSGTTPKIPENFVTSAAESLRGLSSSSEVAAQLSKLATMSGSSVKDLWSAIMNSPNPSISDSTRSILNQMGPGSEDYGFGSQAEYIPGAGGGPDAEAWNLTGGVPESGIDWSSPDSIDWGNVDINNFTSSDWNNMADWFGDGAA